MIAARDAQGAAELAEGIRSASIASVIDVVGGADSVLVTYDPLATGPPEIEDTLSSVITRRKPRIARTLAFDTCFDGPDLAEVGNLSGLGSDGVRRALLASPLRVSFIGFSPGFAYLSGLPRALRRVGRRAAPRLSVPAGSLALGRC